MAKAGGVAHHTGIEDLVGGVLRHRAGNHPAPGTFAIQIDFHIAFGHLVAMGEQPLGYHGLGILAADNLGITLGGIHAPDLGGIHLNGGTFVQIDNGLRLHYPSALAVTLAVVLFAVLHPGVLSQLENVDTIVTGRC